ncbi:hypothetical protein PFISCL1PPCAC_25029, partial [Pristionchus fissidentatus]
SDFKMDDNGMGSAKPGFLIDELLMSSVKEEMKAGSSPSDDASESMGDFPSTQTLPFPSLQLAALLQSGFLSGAVPPPANLLQLPYLQQLMSVMPQLQAMGA